MNVMASGLRKSLPNFANILFHDTPTDTVQPSSALMRPLISAAVRAESPPRSGSEPVRSSHASSRPNGSTRSVYW